MGDHGCGEGSTLSISAGKSPFGADSAKTGETAHRQLIASHIGIQKIVALLEIVLSRNDDMTTSPLSSRLIYLASLQNSKP